MKSERIAALAQKLAEDYVERYHTDRSNSTKGNEVAEPITLPGVGETLPPVKKLVGGKES